MQHKFRTTIYACFTGYIVQAIVNNFAPLLFLTFEKTYQIPLGQITMLITINFGIQLCIDLLSAGFVDRIGYRASILIAHVFAALGLLGLAVLPELFPNAFAGLLTAVVIYAIGGGLIEVLISPIMESCPTDNKEKAMSLLHSFYCWGHVAFFVISTLFFKVFGIEHWKVLTCLWVIVPVVNVFAFLKAPMAPLVEEGESGLSLRDLCRQKVFWLLMLMMLCAGASEQSVSQWASTFAEQGLGVSKMVGDLAGPMAFAVLMGSARAFYGKFGDKMDLDRFMTGSSILCVIAYLCISLVPGTAVSLLGCALCGLSVGIMWPGTFSKASAALKNGGTVMFAMLALAGDLGCSGGPTLVGGVSSAASDNLKAGILAAIVFPLLLLAAVKVLGLLSDERSVIRHFPKGAFIFKELDRPGQVYVLLDGKVVIAKGTLSGKRILITRIEQSGEMFGEVYAFLGKACYPMYAEAAEDTSVLIVDNDIFFGEDVCQPRAVQKMRNNLLTVFANKAYRMNQKLRVLGGGVIREKIACFLVEQQDKEGRINSSFSREEMADYLNVARPSLSRELGKMQKEGIISLERRQIQIKDQKRLEEYL